MKKIAAFFSALSLFIILILGFHFSMDRNLNMNNRAFGTWYSPYKDLSYNAISQNMHDETMMIFGSSEFRHGRKTRFHPKNAFKKNDTNLMLVGGPYNQSLSHAITLGAVSNKIKNKKVVILVSPTWFYKRGITPERYSLRFSENSYIAFMKNKKIPMSTKRYVGKRSYKLLEQNKPMQRRVWIYNELLLKHSQNPMYKILFHVRESFINDKDVITVEQAYKLSGLKRNKTLYTNTKKNETLNFNTLEKKASLIDGKKVSNSFNMSDEVWKRKMEKKYPIAKNVHSEDTVAESPEYDDLKCFIDVCKAESIKPMIIVLPVNGKWFDYTGLTADKRAKLSKNIREYEKKYGVKVDDLSRYDYEPLITLDAVHPWGKGWVKIDESINKFYKEN